MCYFSWVWVVGSLAVLMPFVSIRVCFIFTIMSGVMPDVDDKCILSPSGWWRLVLSLLFFAGWVGLGSRGVIRRGYTAVANTFAHGSMWNGMGN